MRTSPGSPSLPRSLVGALVLVHIALHALASPVRTPHPEKAFARYAPYSKPLTEGRNYATIQRRLNGEAREAGGPAATLPLCSQEDLLAGSLPGLWRHHQLTGQFFFEPRTCRLQRRTHGEALQCLAGKRVSFAGDSVSRQHFTTFVTWIATGYLPQPYDDGMFSPTNAYKWKTWEEYFEGLEKRVVQGPRKLARLRGQARAAPRVRFTMRNPAYDKDVKSKRMALELHGIRPNNASLHLDYVFAATMPAWVQAGTNALDAVFGDEDDDDPRPAPDFLILNMGAWWQETESRSSNEDLADKMGSIFKYGSKPARQRGGNTTLLWRTSMIQNWGARNKLVSARAQELEWGVLDASGLAQAMYLQRLWLSMRRTDGRVDKYHFLPVVYEQLIDILLARICP